MPQKIGKKVGIHFYENILSEINLPLKHVQNATVKPCGGPEYSGLSNKRDVWNKRDSTK